MTGIESKEEKHQLEYSIYSCKVSWCPICNQHFYNERNSEHTTKATEEHYHIVTRALSSLPVQEGDIVEKMNILADEYVAKQGSHDTPHITKHDFIQDYMAANQSTPSQEGDKAPIDAGRLFDTNFDCYADARHKDSLFTLQEAMSREKFIEVLEQLRIPDAGKLEKIIGDAFIAGETCESLCRRGYQSEAVPRKQYIKQAMEQLK